MPDITNTNPSRRDFIRSSGAVLGAAGVFSIGSSAHAQKNTVLKVGLVGSGGRGGGAAIEALSADPDTQLFAMADTFADRIDEKLGHFVKTPVADRIVVDEEHKFTGFDAYKKVIDCCDVVILTTPPAFRPVQLAYAVEKGKHVFCEKPIAVDPAGVLSVLETCKKAKAKGLSIVSGLCYRYQFSKQDTIFSELKNDLDTYQAQLK